MQFVNVLALVFVLGVTCSCSRGAGPVGDSREFPPEMKKAEIDLMREFGKMSWFAPALNEVRVAIASHHKVTGKWPRSLSDLKNQTVTFEYWHEGKKKKETLTDADLQIELTKEDVISPTYNFIMRGVDCPQQVIDPEELGPLKDSGD